MDLDNAFENLVQNINPVTPIKDKWNEISNDCKGFNYGQFNLMQKSAACDKIIGSLPIIVLSMIVLIKFSKRLYNMPNISHTYRQMVIPN